MTTVLFNELLSYVKPLLVERVKINLRDMEAGVFKMATLMQAKNEYSFHHNKFNNKRELVSVLYNEYGCKVLSKRVIDNIFMECLENDLRDDDIIGALTELGGNISVLSYMKYVLFNMDDIKSLYDVYFQRLSKVFDESQEFINGQKEIEQKTKEWFAVRENMISASTAGYMCSKDCNLSISKERDEIMKKSGMKTSSFCGWNMRPTRHGQQYEDITGDIYNTLNNIESREYGILTDEIYNNIGASPDGIINKLKNETDFMTRTMLGRMREIKNPVSRAVNNKIPEYYYYQMQQQLYVAKLPFCDFIQTEIRYPDNCSMEVFMRDTMTRELLIERCTNWNELTSLICLYLLENMNWSNLHINFSEMINNEPVSNLNNVFLNIVINNWNDIMYFPMNNINKRGELKGIAWSFIKKHSDTDIDFRMEWLNITEDYTKVDIDSILNNYIMLHAQDGFELSITQYWNCQEYKVIEVEYNEVLYKNNILPKLQECWDLVLKLRRLKNNTDAQQELLYSKYPEVKKSTTRKRKSPTNKSSSTKSSSINNNHSNTGLYDLGF